MNTPSTNECYSALEPMFKFTFDQFISESTICFMFNLLENLQLYSLLNEGEFIKLMGPNKFLDQAALGRGEFEKLLKENTSNCFIVKEIKDTLNSLDEQVFLNEIYKTQKEFSSIYDEIKKPALLNRLDMEDELKRGVLKLRVNIEKLIDKRSK